MLLFEEIVWRKESISIFDFVKSEEFSQFCPFSQYAVAVNGKLVNKGDYAATILNPNDKIAVFPLLGGG